LSFFFQNFQFIFQGEIIAQMIERFDQLEVLEFRGNTLGVAASGPIADAIAFRPDIKVFIGEERNYISKNIFPLKYSGFLVCGGRILSEKKFLLKFSA
jgi:hypothetical protein